MTRWAWLDDGNLELDSITKGEPCTRRGVMDPAPRSGVGPKPVLSAGPASTAGRRSRRRSVPARSRSNRRSRNRRRTIHCTNTRRHNRNCSIQIQRSTRHRGADTSAAPRRRRRYTRNRPDRPDHRCRIGGRIARSLSHTSARAATIRTTRTQLLSAWQTPPSPQGAPGFTVPGVKTPF